MQKQTVLALCGRLCDALLVRQRAQGRDFLPFRGNVTSAEHVAEGKTTLSCRRTDGFAKEKSNKIRGGFSWQHCHDVNWTVLRTFRTLRYKHRWTKHSHMYEVTEIKSNFNNYHKHQILMSGYSGTGKSIWPGDHHLRGRSIVPVYPVWCRILLRSHKVAVRLLKEIALLVGHWLTPHISQGNTHLGGSRCLKKPDRHTSQVQYLLCCYCFTQEAYSNMQWSDDPVWLFALLNGKELTKHL